jgi:hypothetical protein
VSLNPPGCGLYIKNLVHHKAILAAFPIHDYKQLNELQAKWLTLFAWKQPIGKSVISLFLSVSLSVSLSLCLSVCLYFTLCTLYASSFFVFLLHLLLVSSQQYMCYLATRNYYTHRYFQVPLYLVYFYQYCSYLLKLLVQFNLVYTRTSC